MDALGQTKAIDSNSMLWIHLVLAHMTIYQGSHQLFNRNKSKKPCQRSNLHSYSGARPQVSHKLGEKMASCSGHAEICINNWTHQGPERWNVQLLWGGRRSGAALGPGGSRLTQLRTSRIKIKKAHFNQRLGSFAWYLLGRMFQQMQSWVQSDVASTTWGQRH